MTEVALNKLTQWDGNVRKTNAAEGIEELTASIAAHGLLNPLTVTAIVKGKYAVVAGQRRLMALQALAAKGKIGKTAAIECNVVSNDADLTEISLAENVVRTQMHPADQFDAWRALADKGSSPAEIAARFGVSDGLVTKRLKLGRVSPVLLDLYRQDEMSLDQIQAFTVTDDQAEQERVWNALDKWNRHPSDIRRALTQDEIRASDKRVKFIGLNAYEAAGGAVRRDLFDTHNEGWVIDPVLLDRLVSEKLEAIAAEVRGEGWSWVEVRDSFDWDEQRQYDTLRGKPAPLTPEEQAEQTALTEEYDELAERANNEEELTDEESSRIDALESLINQLDNRPAVLSPEAKASSGVVITLDHGGEACVQRGLCLKGDAPKASLDGAPKVKSAFSAALVENLTQEVTGAMQAEFAVNPKVALVAVVHAFAMRRGFEAAVKLSGETFKTPAQSSAKEALEKAEAAALQGMPEGDEAWAWLEGQSQERLLEMLAALTAQHVTADAKGSGDLRKALGGNLRDWFTPNAENYFGRVSRDQILKDMGEWGMDTKAYESMKKAPLAETAARHVTADWVPPPMRLG